MGGDGLHAGGNVMLPRGPRTVGVVCITDIRLHSICGGCVADVYASYISRETIRQSYLHN